VGKSQQALILQEGEKVRQYNSSMRFLRYLYVLALVLWLGGMTIAGLVVAPVTFGVLEAWNPSTGRVLAGDVFGAVLARLSVVGYVAGVVMFLVLTIQRLLGPRPRSYGIRVGVIIVMMALTYYSDRVAAPRIDELQSQVSGPMHQLPATDARRVEFDRLHGLSTSLTMAAIIGGLVLIGWETRE
jgi:hypothetical protein